MKKIALILKNCYPYLLLFTLCFWAIKPLFIPGFFTIHDDEQIARLIEMSKVLGQGQMPPRWVPDLGFGYGYPLFNFYPPFVYYLGSLIHSIGFSFINATKIVMGLGFFLSALFMYLWTKNRFGVLAGLLAAFLYTYAPYHSVDLYVRGALSEFFSFIFIPAVFWSLDRLTKSPSLKKLVVSSVLLCLVVVTHTLVMLQFAPFLLFYLLFLLWEEKKSYKELLPYFLSFGLLGFGLSAYFAVPSLMEKQYTLVDGILITQLANYAIHFVCPSQFWNSLWGYGGSIAGCVDGLSFQVGKVHIILSILALFIALAGLIWKKYKTCIAFFTIFLFLFSLFMATDYSKFIWDGLQPFWYIQFPWRFLLFSAVFSSFLGGYVLFSLEKFFGKKIAIVACLLFGLLAWYQIRQDFQPQTYLPVGDNYYIDNQDIQWRVSRLSYEYVPKEVATRLSKQGTTELAIDKKDIPTSPFTVITGNMKIQMLENTATNKSFSIQATSPGTVQVNTYAFPGWKTYRDGKEVSYTANNMLHLMQVPIPQGKHILEALLTNTPIRAISNSISLISAIVLLLLLFLPRRKKLI